MPILVPYRPAAACALAIVLLASGVATASAKKVEADLRVVGKGSKVLAEKTLKTGTTRIPTSPRADCFGKGTGGSGRPSTAPGATALGLLAQAASKTKSLRPLLITDSFSFGLGICGVGGSNATSKVSWYLKVNHENPELGGEAVKLERGDEVLWALARFPYPDELALEGPRRATPGDPFNVRVFSYDEKGKRKPVQGAKVAGARPGARTDAAGRARVTVSHRTVLRAFNPGEIPSNGLTVSPRAAH